jgi:hypothetical protein
MNQLTINFDAPPLPVAAALGQAGAQLAADRAERHLPGFTERAQAFVVAYLQQHGPASGEAITDACKGAGIVPPDDRAFGAVYQGLARRGVIEVAGWCLRRKGHGTAGGRVWRLAA